MQREARRGNKYDGIILDPPKFGRGSGGKVWDFYKNLPDLLVACKQVLSDTPLFIVMTSYAIQASALIAFQAVEMMTTNLSGKIQTGELISVEESANHKLSHALFARWASTP
jgi:23S rRNA (cytosine1962-C5)-methyltransferase